MTTPAHHEVTMEELAAIFGKPEATGLAIDYQLGRKVVTLEDGTTYSAPLEEARPEVGTVANPYKGFMFRIGAPRGDGKPVQIWSGELVVQRVSSIPAAIAWVDEHGAATLGKVDGRG